MLLSCDDEPPEEDDTFSARVIVTGLREFLLGVSSKEAGDYVLVLSESASAPSWNSIQDHPVRIQRSFSQDEQQIYFSLTNRFPKAPNGGILLVDVDFNNKGSMSEAEYTRDQAPGVLIPDTSYFLYIYKGGSSYPRLGPFKTAPYPTIATPPTAYGSATRGSDYTPGFTTDPNETSGTVGQSDYTTTLSQYPFWWGMDMWLNSDDTWKYGSTSKPIKIGRNDVYGAVYRLYDPIDRDNLPSSAPPAGIAACTSAQGTTFFKKNTVNQLSSTSPDGIDVDTTPDPTNYVGGSVAAFRNSSQINYGTFSADEVYDVVLISREPYDPYPNDGITPNALQEPSPATWINVQENWNFSDICFDAGGFNNPMASTPDRRFEGL